MKEVVKAKNITASNDLSLYVKVSLILVVAIALATGYLVYTSYKMNRTITASYNIINFPPSNSGN